MRGFVLHPNAVADLDEIWEYIAVDNLGAADRVLEEIYDAIGTLISFPEQGNGRPDLSSRPLKVHSIRDFLIVYAPAERPLFVVAVLHGRRNPRVIRAMLRDRK